MVRHLLLSIVWMCFASCPCAAQEAATGRPNVIVILGDDIGFSDLGCYGGEARTPHLDALATNGLRFTQFYNTARCCPTRASLLTGLYPHQAGMGHMLEDRGEDGYRGDLNRQCVTLAEVLGDAGYRTYALGKWHVSRSGRPGGARHNWPLQRGFDKYYGTIWGAASFFDPGICRGNTWYSCENDTEYKPEKYYFTTAMSDNAVTFLKQHEKESPDRPFFMYAAYTAAHWPMHALEEDIAKYKGRFDAGYEKLREERVARLKKLGMLKPEWEITPTVGKWEEVEHREWELRCMEVYAAMLDSMDQGIGKIVAELRRQGQLDNTVILFMQDNGGCAEGVGRSPERAAPDKMFPPLRPDELPSGIHPKQTRDGRPVRHGPGALPGGPDTYIAYGQGWANVSNTPFREYKHWVHEGGISTPLIVHWPNGIEQSRRNGLVSDPAHLIDIMATCVDVAQTSYPSERNGEKIKPMRGVSLRPVLEGKPLHRAEPIFWEHEGNRAVREGKWKIVAKEDQPWELYDMDADRTEMNDLAKASPERVREMAAKWDGYARRSDVLPLGTWKKEREKPRQSRVELKAGDTLSSADSPNVGENSLRVTVEIVRPEGDGVLAAQGGTVHGYAFYVRESRLHFDVRRDGELKTVTAGEPLLDSATTAVAVLATDGTVRLHANGKRVVLEKKIGTLSRTPGDGLSAGSDSGDPVGNYAAPFSYPGELGAIVVETGAAGRSGLKRR